MPATSQMMFTEECHSSQPTEKHAASERIPRPPNAFILYRSDLLKRRAIPPEVEKRQQNLSRIAGQCWNMLPGAEKAIWFSKAADIRAEHHAKYPFYQTRPSRKETRRLLAKEKGRGGTTNSVHPSGRFKARRTRTPYCKGMFAALHDSNFYSPESEANFTSLTTASESLSFTTALLSPLRSPYLLSPFTSHNHSGRQGSPLSASENSPIRGGDLGYLLDSSGSEISQCSLSHMAPGEIGTSPEPYPVSRQREDDLAFGAPYLESAKLRCDPFAQVTLSLSGSSTFPYHNSSLNDFHVADTFAHFSQSLVMYPRHSEEPNTSN